jgi:hypothetical protein
VEFACVWEAFGHLSIFWYFHDGQQDVLVDFVVVTVRVIGADASPHEDRDVVVGLLSDFGAVLRGVHECVDYFLANVIA